MNFKRIIILSFAFLLSSAVNAQMLSNLNINGNVTNSQYSKIYLTELTEGKMNVVDSSFIEDNGDFQINTNIDKANFFQLTFGGEEYAILILKPNEHIGIKLNSEELIKPISVKGSEGTVFVYEMLNDLDKFKMKQDSLEVIYESVYGTPEQDSVGSVLAKQYQIIEDEKKAFLKNKLENNINLGALLFLEQLDISNHSELYIKFDNVLYEKYPDNVFVKSHHEKVENHKRLMPGNPAPEIALPDTINKIAKLSELRGKVVLIDFWAAWCKPCREESPNMVRMYNKFNDKGFEIYGVSLDKQKSDWIRAIRDDGLNWTHVSDLRGWKSAAGQDYGVKSIPHTVLIDREGNIIATGLRGAALEQKLEEIFSE